MVIQQNTDYLFKIMYKMKNSNINMVEDMVAGHLSEVMAHLKAQGINKSTVKQLFVHQITQDGVAELITIDNEANIKPGNDKPPFDKPSNIVDLDKAREAKKEKPHIRLRAADMEVRPAPPKVVVGGLYVAAML